MYDTVTIRNPDLIEELDAPEGFRGVDSPMSGRSIAFGLLFVSPFWLVLAAALSLI